MLWIQYRRGLNALDSQQKGPECFGFTTERALMLWVHSRRGVNTLWVHSRRGLNFRVRGTAPQNRTDMKCTCHWGRPVHSWAVLLRRPKQAFPPPEAIIFMTNEDTEQSLVLKAAPLTLSLIHI